MLMKSPNGAKPGGKNSALDCHGGVKGLTLD
jgi:hypothetical protein